MAVVDQITALCETYMKTQPDMPSLVVGYMQGTVPTLLEFGTLERNGQGGAPTSTSIYQIGSVTKTFTGTALAWMVANGSIVLSDPVQNYVPTYANGGVTLPEWGSLPPAPGTQEITFLELADFTPGFKTDGPGGLTPKSTWPDLADYISNQSRLISPPGSEYAYVDDAFELLGSSVTWVWGGQTTWSYASLLTALLASGNGFDMPDTVIVLSAEQESRVVQGYNAGGAVNQPGGDWRIKSTLADMMVWLSYNMNLLDGCPLNNLLPYMRKPYFTLPNTTISTSLGWFMQPITGTITRYYKNGVCDGYSSYMALDMTNPSVAANNNGVIILNNLRESKPGRLANCILDTLAGRPCAAANQALSGAEAGG
jgi:CubicO group peptidase (beta-lactamase class C family)